jgi:hypothetical protein
VSRPPPDFEAPPDEPDIDDLGQAAAQERAKHHGTTRPPGFYAPLKEAHKQQQAKDSPERPESRTVGPPGWPDRGDYVSQTTAAREWVKHNEAQRPPPRETQGPGEDLSNRASEPGRNNDAQRSAQTNQPGQPGPKQTAEAQHAAPREQSARETTRQRTDQTQTTDSDETERAARENNPERTRQAPQQGRGGGRGGRSR